MCAVVSYMLAVDIVEELQYTKYCIIV